MVAVVIAQTQPDGAQPGEETVSQPPDTLNSDVAPGGEEQPPPGEPDDSEVPQLQDDIQPVNCVVGVWGLWSKCSKTCGHGIETRTRMVTTEADQGGAACPILQEEQNCMIRTCPAPPTNAPTEVTVNCQVASWSEWSKCTSTCGSGFESRSRLVVQDAAHGGTACPPLGEDKNCEVRPCPPPASQEAVDCQVGGWGPWSQCSKTCGTGFTLRIREVIANAEYGGAECSSLAEGKDCVLQECKRPKSEIRNKTLVGKI